MRTRLLAGFVAFALVFIVLLDVPLGLSLARNARSTAVSELESNASPLAVLISPSVSEDQVAKTKAVIDDFSESYGGVVAVLVGGQLFAAAGKDAGEELSDTTTKAIVKSAEVGRQSGIQGSDDPDDQYVYVALPVAMHVAAGSGGRQTHIAVLLVAVPAGPVNHRIAGDWYRLIAFGLVMLAVAAGVGALLARSLTRPLGAIESAVAALGGGKMDVRAPIAPGPAELRAFGSTVNEMADRLEELIHSQRAFVADASHQLRTPLTALRLRLENLESAGPAEVSSDALAAGTEVDRLSRIVDGLLSLARTEGSRPERHEVNIEEVLRSRVEAWTALAEERQVSLALSLSQAGTHVLACDGHIEQMIDNFLANALEVTPQSGWVEVKAARVDSWVEIHVVDSGPGMSAADRERAFDRFWRPEGAHHEGSGLGLAIVAQLARVSGGVAWLSEAEGGGIDAVVRLEAC